MPRPLMALTMGDPAGIGPEIVARAACDRRLREAAVPLVCGDPEVMQRAVILTGASLAVRAVCGPSEVSAGDGELCVMRGTARGADPFEPGRPQAVCGEVAYRYILDAIDLALAGSVAGVVTAPISKEALALAGHSFPGHTEIFAERTASPDFALMLVDGPRRVVHATCHARLADALALLTVERIVTTLGLAERACRALGVGRPRLLVCAVNPHAGEAGMFGPEERELVAPAVARALELGFDATGPIAADTAFVRAFSGEFDAVVAMYHDQGHIPFKLACFQASGGRLRRMRGVNVTLGLPIVRTSVDHGTAWEIAWRGEALAESLLDAVELAAKLAGARGFGPGRTGR